jgi:hypothetical protein
MHQRRILCTLPLSFVTGGAARVGQLSSFMHLSGQSRAIKFLYAPTPPPPTVWALKPSLWALVPKTTYTPMHNVLDACISITWESGRGLGPRNLEFLGTKWHSPICLMSFHRAQKTFDFQGPTPSHLPSQWICTHPKHCARV